MVRVAPTGAAKDRASGVVLVGDRVIAATPLALVVTPSAKAKSVTGEPSASVRLRVKGKSVASASPFSRS